MHLAPRGDAHSMGDSDPATTFGYVVRELGKRRLAFLCARESVGATRLGPQLKQAFGGVYIANEGHTRDSAEELLRAGEADAVAFGKAFIANPDLVRRFATNASLNTPDPGTFYGQGPGGYLDYPCLPEAR
jgi:2,4-dienoyl-CoA reductase-like NADH-dependent reductase (Old Yellow Enzyme family)